MLVTGQVSLDGDGNVESLVTHGTGDSEYAHGYSAGQPPRAVAASVPFFEPALDHRRQQQHSAGGQHQQSRPIGCNAKESEAAARRLKRRP